MANDCFQSELVDAYCEVPEPRVKLLLIVTRPFSGKLDASAVINSLTKGSENNFQLTVGGWKFNLHSTWFQHLDLIFVRKTLNSMETNPDTFSFNAQ